MIARVNTYLFEYYDQMLKDIDPKVVTDIQRRALEEAFYHARTALGSDAFVAWYRKTDDAFNAAAQWRLLIPLQEEVTAFIEQKYEENHLEVATSLNNLAGLYESQGRYGEAEPLYERSLNIIETQLGKDHPDVASLLNNVAESYRTQKRYAEAKSLFERSLKILETHLGEDHPNTKVVRGNYERFLEAWKDSS